MTLSEAALAAHVVRLQEDTTQDHQWAEDQHRFITSTVADLQFDILEAHPDSNTSNNSTSITRVNDLYDLFNQSIWTMKALTHAVSDSNAMLMGIRSRLGSIEACLE